MKAKRSNEGYLFLDHRDSPGLPDALTHATGPELPLGIGRGLFEAPTITCSHCQAIVIVNPLRNRDRGYCSKCDHYVCDTCNAIRIANGGACKTFNQIIAEVQEAAAQSESIKEL